MLKQGSQKTAWSSIYWGMRRRDPALHVGPGHHIFFLSTLQSIRNPDSPEGQEETRMGRAALFTELVAFHSWRNTDKRETCYHCCWSFSTLATWCKEPAHWKRPWPWEILRAGEGGGREWDGWMASPTQCTWVWANSGRWWRTGKPDVLQSMGLQRVRPNSDWTTTNYSAKPGGTSDFALRCFFLSHIFLLFLPDHQGSRPVLLPQSSTWIQERPHRSPQDFVHTCLRLFTVLPWPLSNHHVSSSMVSISPISEMTEPSWGPSSENIMWVCRDVFFHLFV